MKFIATLQRIKEFENIKKPNKTKIEGSTLGEFIVTNEKGNKVFSCFTIENAGPSTDTPNQDKRIVAREYKLYWTESSVTLPKEYGRKCLSLYTDSLPSFKNRRIHIHIGNYPQDTEGCILLNHRSLGNGIGSESTRAVKEFYDLVSREGVENFTLVVKEIEG
ncbi:DUF5675 family protein [uncultured Helicobacter sp.]|uniref:DUF5675 family protein n=1 Tax=uncultured Helicobacter sp. TaxID=175537 RepID=UPI00374F5658